MSPTQRHPDFERIKSEFENYYCKGTMPCPKGDQEYYSWLKALSLDETLPYGQTKESFTWAKDMIQFLREDEDNKYYKILVGFPLASMNENVYSERDLVAAALTLAGVHPSLNHKDEFWFSPDNPDNNWGVLTVIGGKYEDGAVESILQVPKNAVCPICNGAKMTSLLDSKRIVNVSLEGGCAYVIDDLTETPTKHECMGFRFNEKGFSLLTTDVLPGIPLARVFPIESFLPFSKARHKRVKIVGLESMSKKQKEADLSGTPDPTPEPEPKVVPLDPKGQCPEGTIYSDEYGGCVPLTDDKATHQTHVPEGTEIAQGKGLPDTSKKPLLENMTDDEIYKAVGEPGDFDACVAAVMAKGKDEDAARRICAAKCQGESLNQQLTAAILKRREAEQKAGELDREVLGLRTDLAKANKAYADETAVRIKLEGRIQELRKSKDEYEERMRQWNIDRIELEAKYNKRSTELTEALDNVKKYKDLLENTQAELQAVTTKYRESLTTNMILNTKITSLNEETLKLLRQSEDFEERLKKAKRFGKRISTQI